MQFTTVFFANACLLHPPTSYTPPAASANTPPLASKPLVAALCSHHAPLRTFISLFSDKSLLIVCMREGDQVVITSWDATLLNNKDYIGEVRQSMARCALFQLHSEHADTKRRLVLTIAPSIARTVRAKVDIKAESLVIVPVSRTIGLTTKDKSVPDSSLVLSIDGPGDGIMYVSPMYPVQAKAAAYEFGNPRPEMVVPFWCVESTADLDNANMIWKLFKVTQAGKSICIPCLTNSKAITAHGKLLVHRRAGITRKYDVPDDIETAPSKRARK